MTDVATAARMPPALFLAGCLATSGPLVFHGPLEFTKALIVRHRGADTVTDRAAGASARDIRPNTDQDGFREAVAALESIARLSDGWDGGESIAPSSTVIARAREALGLVYGADLAARRVLATRDGGVGVYAFRRNATPGRGVPYFRVGLDADGSTQFESGSLGAADVEAGTLIDSLERRIEDWAASLPAGAATV